ncbi:hypothetical protein [Pseudomonas juntendi]|uniref:Uncharacterized protein n=1 Tax=Pseudomonas juntendi TaxID=2666183 RepID=A0ABZ2JHB9_9PSED
MERLKHILSQIAAGQVQAVDEGSDPSYWEVKELKDAGYVTAIDSSADDGYSLMEIRIALAGRSFIGA